MIASFSVKIPFFKPSQFQVRAVKDLKFIASVSGTDLSVALSLNVPHH